MSQITWTNGIVTHTLPYPAEYNSPEKAPVAVYTSYGGYRTVHRRFAAPYVRPTIIQWEQIGEADLLLIAAAYRDLQDAELWDYTGPAGEVAFVRINPDVLDMNIVRGAGPDGTVEYTVRIGVVLEVT